MALLFMSSRRQRRMSTKGKTHFWILCDEYFSLCFTKYCLKSLNWYTDVSGYHAGYEQFSVLLLLHCNGQFDFSENLYYKEK